MPFDASGFMLRGGSPLIVGVLRAYIASLHLDILHYIEGGPFCGPTLIIIFNYSECCHTLKKNHHFVVTRSLQGRILRNLTLL